jgi:hypothetical protein
LIYHIWSWCFATFSVSLAIYLCSCWRRTTNYLESHLKSISRTSLWGFMAQAAHQFELFVLGLSVVGGCERAGFVRLWSDCSYPLLSPCQQLLPTLTTVNRPQNIHHLRLTRVSECPHCL